MRKMFFLFLLFMTLPLVADIPILQNGRLRPSKTVHDETLALPQKAERWQQRSGEWLPLKTLKEARNPTLYSDALYEKLHQAYLGNDSLEALLNEGYTSIAGSIYKEAAGKHLKYPTRGQLLAESFLIRAPLPLFALIAYFASALFIKKRRLSWLLFYVAFALHTLALVLRIYVLGRPPVSNMAETLLYVPWIAALTGSLLRHHFSAAIVAGGLLLFTPTNPALENVQAVLDSQYWLLIHVLMVVGSYGVFFFSGVIGHILLVQRRPNPQLAALLLRTLYIGTGLLVCGTILGGVWAAESWGRFWDWDPKEAWAFISSGALSHLYSRLQIQKNRHARAWHRCHYWLDGHHLHLVWGQLYLGNGLA